MKQQIRMAVGLCAGILALLDLIWLVGRCLHVKAAEFAVYDVNSVVVLHLMVVAAWIWAST